MKLVTAQVMVRNEPLVFFAIASVIDYVDRVIVFDTGSTDDTLKDIEYAQSEFGDKIELYKRQLPNSQQWTIGLVHSGTIESHPGFNELGDIRREIHAMTDTEYSLILDGDEVYPDGLIQDVKQWADNDAGGTNIVCSYVPVIDFYGGLYQIHQRHSFGRLFKTTKVEVKGGYPVEMHYSKVSGRSLDNSPHECNFVPTAHVLHHHEMLVKPWRRKPVKIEQFDGPWPEVYSRYLHLYTKRMPVILEGISE